MWNDTICWNRSAELEPNDDISGPGVLVGFFGTGWLVTALVIGYYLTSNGSGAHPETSSGSHGSATVQANPFDGLIISLLHRLMGPARRFLRRLLPFSPLPSPKNTSKALEKCILAMCDVQIVTGLGIMTAGYITVVSSNLVTYYWRLVVYLAWFSNLTHQAALIFLRDYLRQHPGECVWRFCLMTFLVVMLLVALPPIAFDSPSYWLRTSPGANVCAVDLARIPVRCLYNPERAMGLFETKSAIHCTMPAFSTSQGLQSVVVSVVVLVSSYTLRSIRLFATTSSWVQKTLKGFLSFAYRRAISKVFQWKLPRRLLGNERWSFLVSRPILGLYIFGRLSVDLFSSSFSDIYFLVISATVGTFRLFHSLPLFVYNEYGFGARDETNKDNTQWGFGQLLAVFLLIGPLLMLAHSLFNGHSQDSPLPVAIRCHRCSSLLSDNSHQPDFVTNAPNSQQIFNTTNILDFDQEIDKLLQRYYTTGNLDFNQEISQLFQRCYQRRSVWNKYTIYVMTFTTIVCFLLLFKFMDRGYSVIVFVYGFVVPVLTTLITCYNMIIYGLWIEGWQYEGDAALLGAILSSICAALPLLGIAIGPEISLFNTDILFPYNVFIAYASLGMSFLPLIAYFAIVPLVICVTGRGRKRPRVSTRPSQQDTTHTGHVVVVPQDASHRYLTSPSLESGGPDQPGQYDSSFELHDRSSHATPNAACETAHS